MAGEYARSQLRGGRFADLRWVDETGSTNSDLLALARQGAPDGVVLVADHQTAGRGRLGRTWEAPSGSSLLMSVLLRPPGMPSGMPTGTPTGMRASDAHLYTMALGLSALEAVVELSGIEARLKWPNDLVVHTPEGERKLAGILAESELEGDRLAVLVLGLGLNVSWPQALPDELAGIATALNHLSAAVPDREELAAAILVGLERRCAALERPGGSAGLRAEYERWCATIGARVRVDLGVEVLEGDATGVSDLGHLVVSSDGGQVEVPAGDVVHVRTA